MSETSSKQVDRAFARAPFRVDPAGGGTDAPPFCIDHGGAVVNIAVRRHAFASAQRLPAGEGIVIYSTDSAEGVVVDRPSELRRDDRMQFLKAFVARMVPESDSLLLVTESDVPKGSGLGGSGSLGVAIVAAIDAAYGRTRSVAETAELANEVERRDLGFPGGNQDSYGVAVGGIKLLEYRKGGGMTCQQLQVSTDTRRALERRSLLIYTGAAHVSGNIHADIKQAYERQDERLMRAMFSLRAHAFSMAEALEAGSLDGYAQSLGECCRHLYDLHEGCDSPEHRRLLDSVDDLILGGKTCGAGGGGFLLLFTKSDCRRQCIRCAEEQGALVWPVTIDDDGVTTWHEAALRHADVERFRKLALAEVDA
jgi:D-glycero-alpha-D-manno-heptose-7-phosphate kinase